MGEEKPILNKFGRVVKVKNLDSFVQYGLKDGSDIYADKKQRLAPLAVGTEGWFDYHEARWTSGIRNIMDGFTAKKEEKTGMDKFIESSEKGFEMNRVDKTYSAVPLEKNERIEEIFEILKAKLFAEASSKTAVSIEREELRDMQDDLSAIHFTTERMIKRLGHLLEPPVTKEDDIKPVVIDTKAEYGD